MTAPALVLRLTQDAESAAARGQRHVALQLATMALDFCGGDQATFWRIVGVRDAALAAVTPTEDAATGSRLDLSLPDLSVDFGQRTSTVFGDVLDSPFGEDGPTILRRPVLPLPLDGQAAPVRRTTVLNPEPNFLTGPEAERGLFAPLAMVSLVVVVLAAAIAAQPLNAGLTLDRLGWRQGAVFLVEQAAGSLVQSAEAHATLGAWHLERSDGAVAVKHFRLAAQMGLPWERIPEIVAALKAKQQNAGAAEVLIAAFGAGAPKEAWPMIVQELRLLGHPTASENVRQMTEGR